MGPAGDREHVVRADPPGELLHRVIRDEPAVVPLAADVPGVDPGRRAIAEYPDAPVPRSVLAEDRQHALDAEPGQPGGLRLDVAVGPARVLGPDPVARLRRGLVELL